MDEAHQVAAAPQRSAAVDQIARRARHVVLLTATPHAGDEAAYQALCGIGASGSDDPLGVFRRTRAQVGRGRTAAGASAAGAPQRRGAEMHRLLGALRQRLSHIARAGREPELLLVATVLTKRALSSAAVAGAFRETATPPSVDELPSIRLAQERPALRARR